MGWNGLRPTVLSLLLALTHSLEPGETPSNSASHQTPDYSPIEIVMYVAEDIRSIKVETLMEWMERDQENCQYNVIIFSSLAGLT